MKPMMRDDFNFEVVNEEWLELLFEILQEEELPTDEQQKLRDRITMIAADLDDAAEDAVLDAMVKEYEFYYSKIYPIA